METGYREAGGATRAVDDSAREVEAKVCSYDGSPDTYGTTWASGCFRDGLEADLPAVCWGHDRLAIIGSVTGYRDEPGDGLYATMKLADPEAVPEARKAFSLIKDGHVRGWSFGFRDGKTKADPTHKGARQFTSAHIFEVSPVLRASVHGTRTTSVRSAGEEAPEPVQSADLDAAVAEIESVRSVTVGTVEPATYVTGTTTNVHPDYALLAALAARVEALEGARAEPVAPPVERTTDEMAILTVHSALTSAMDGFRFVPADDMTPQVRNAVTHARAAEVALADLMAALGLEPLPRPVPQIDQELRAAMSDQSGFVDMEAEAFAEDAEDMAAAQALLDRALGR